MNDLSLIQAVIDEYLKSEIQAEAEVSSKFIIPLVKALGYPMELMSQEFPVYGYAGREKLSAKNADFLFFTDKEFGKYRGNTQNNKRWVADHSLLVIEAKKPGKMPEDKGQAQFYTSWTKAVAYIQTDGKDFFGYFWNPLSADREVITSSVEVLALKPEILNFTYENILSIKNTGQSVSHKDPQLREFENRVIELVISDEESDIREKTIAYIRECLGKNAIGITDDQAVNRFFSTTKSMLKNDMRYGIPAYMIDFPRSNYKAKLYIDNSIFPLVIGEVTEFYCEDLSRYFFQSEYIETMVEYKKTKLSLFEIGFHVLSQTVSERLTGLEVVKKCLYAKNVRIVVENEAGIQISLPAGKPRKMWTLKDQVFKMHEYWFDEMQKLKAIEEYYEIEFKLQYVNSTEELDNLYQAIDFVYDGIMLNENCTITVPGNLWEEDFVIEEPVLFEENKTIPLQDRIIHGVIFRPYRSAWMPCKIKCSGLAEKDIIRIPACCEYTIVEATG